ncbi:hypothetical protein QVD17_31428 [Tagetes erecta]|uniref:PGG domain-containing protein n=1 Tax=Tagetes erecta TaxID=13708 RepID=A0AAD8K5J9_TARER|nr:hypothetical protein QVD17_31428 [Tagetes erecta]
MINIVGETPSSKTVEGTSRPRTFDVNDASPNEDTTSMKYDQTINILRIASSAGTLPDPSENSEDHMNLVVPLYEATITGDWETAKLIFDKHPNLVVRSDLSKRTMGTTLHVAATTEETKHTLNFVRNLVNLMTKKDLEVQNIRSNTAFWIACANGNLRMALIMLEKNPSLLKIRGIHDLFPLSVCAMTGTHKMVNWLYNNCENMTDGHWKDEDRSAMLLRCLERNFFDVALQIVKDHPQVAGNVSLLVVLAQKPCQLFRFEKDLATRIIELTCRYFGVKVEPAAEVQTDGLKLLKFIWGHVARTMHLGESDQSVQMLASILFVAAESGNTYFIVELLRTYPHLMFSANMDGHTLFHIAVMHRHQSIYNLMYEIGIGCRSDICISVDRFGNNMLHLVGKSSKKMATKKSTASLLLQREVLWYKEIEAIMPHYMREQKNNDGKAPHELFAEENEDLVYNGLQWMKDCMVVATLIITIAFAVAFTVPGGYNQDHGLPIFIHQPTFLIFVIADAISLFSSSTSLLVFLSLLTSRHSVPDFLGSLPIKLMIGLLSLFISVATMMITFSASFFLLYHKGLKWVPILVAAFATLPVFVFAVLEFPLWIDMFRSTFDSRYLFSRKKCVLYTTRLRLRSNNHFYTKFFKTC